MTDNIKIIIDKSDLQTQENLNSNNLKIFLETPEDTNNDTTNSIEVIFDQSDLYIEENNNVDDLTLVFGVSEPVAPKVCDPSWNEVDGDSVDFECGCIVEWQEIEGDQIDHICPEKTTICDQEWNENNSTDFGCGCSKEINDDNSTDFKYKCLDDGKNPCVPNWNDSNNDINCDCIKLWDNASNSFIISCSDDSGTGEPVDLGTFRGGHGESVSFRIYGLEIFKSYDGQYVETTLDIRQTMVTDINVYEGQYSETILSSDKQLLPTSTNTGESSTVTLTTVAAYNIVSNSYEGQESSTDLSANYTFAPTSVIGEYNSVDLSNFPAIPVDVSIYEGQESSTSIDRIIGFIVEADDGSEVNIDLFMPDTGRVPVDVYEGQYTDVNLGIVSSIYPNVYDGNDTSVTLSTYYDLSSVTDQGGESASITFYDSYTYQMNVTALEGTKCTTVVNTAVGFIPVSTIGEYNSVTIEYDPYKGYPTEGYSGESVSFQLNNIQEMSNVNVYEGTKATAVLTTYESFRMVVNAYEGQYSNTIPMFTVILGTFTARDGENITFTLDETPNYEVGIGEQLDFELSNESVIEQDYEMGEYVGVTLTRGEPVILGRVEVTEGQKYTSGVSIRVSTDLSVRFDTGNEMFIEQWTNSPYYIDLDSRKCCKETYDNLLDIELDDAPYNWTKFDYSIQNCELMTFELSTRKTLSFNGYEGQSMAYESDYNTFTVYIDEGQHVYSKDVVTEHYIDLDAGNLIPDGDITIEINRPVIPNEYKFIRMYDGNYVEFKLGAAYGLSDIKYNQGGESVQTELIINPSMKPRAEHGEYVVCVLNTNTQLPFSVNLGNNMTTNLYEEPFVCSDGQYVEVVLDTKSDYYAEFVSSGCLINQYEEIGENGQPIPLEFGGANVEGEKFLNYIEGRCF